MEDSPLLLSLRTRDIIPVDLNSVLCDVEKALAEFNSHLGSLLFIVISQIFHHDIPC